MQINLRAKHTAPANSSDGTLLATVTGIATTRKQPITLVSNDPVTAWEYVWFELLGGVKPAVAQAIFYSPSGLAGVTCAVEILGPALASTAACTTWRLGVFTNSSGNIWPVCGTFHEGRLWLAGAVANRFDASNSNDIFNFAPTAYTAGTVGAANAISYTFNSGSLDDILWMKPDLQGIIAGTLAGEWIITPPTAGALAPTNIAARPLTHYGSAFIEPVRTGLSLVFVQKFKRKLLEFLADVFSGKFFAPNLSEMAKHLTRSGVQEVAYQQELAPVIWARMSDGTLAGCTYKRTSSMSSQPPDFMGWHSHTLGSGRLVESICVGPSADGLLDTLTMVTNDPTLNNPIRHVESLSPLFKEDDSIFASMFLDDAIVPSSGTSKTVNTIPVIQFEGLWPLNGKTVTAFVAGLDCGDFVVTNGHIQVPYGNDDGTTAASLLTARYLTQLTSQGWDFSGLAVAIDIGVYTVPAVVGFTYRSRGQLLRPASAQDGGSQNGPAFAKKRREHNYGAMLHSAAGVSVGTRFTNLHKINFTTRGGRALTPLELFTGIWNDTIEDDYSFDGTISWEISRPYPCTMLALGGFIQTQDQ